MKKAQNEDIEEVEVAISERLREDESGVRTFYGDETILSIKKPNNTMSNVQNSGIVLS